MSDEEEEFEDEEEDEEDEAEEEEEGDDDEDEDGDEDEDEDEDQDDEDGSNQDEDEDGDQDEEEDEDEEKTEEKDTPMPTFKHHEIEEFKFESLLAEISSIGHSVDNFIQTLPSHGGSQYRSYQPKIDYLPMKSRFPPPEPKPEPEPPRRQYTIMKDEDVQVSMQPQTIVQQTIAPREEPKKEPYKISNESTKFLAQLYEQNKRLKRWQNSQLGSQSNGFSQSRGKFERPEHERGLINLDDRNREIDEAIQMLRREDYSES